MYLLILIAVLFLPLPGHAETDEFDTAPQPSEIYVAGAADYPEIAALLQAFEKDNSFIRVHYIESSTKGMFDILNSEDNPGFDVVMSSAMDLQIKLVNDGFARKFTSKQTSTLPQWASWRNEIYGYSYELATIVINKKFFSDGFIPKDRAQLLSYISKNSEEFMGKVATFDINKAGVGYLIWAYDSQQTGSYGRIMESFKTHQVQFFESSSSMLQALSNDEIALAYNVLGSYASSWAEEFPHLQVILPEDYTTVLMRSLFIPKSSPNPLSARVFVNFLLSPKGQKIIAEQSGLYPLRENLEAVPDNKSLKVSIQGPLRPIPLGLPLLVFSDKMKKQLLLDEWQATFSE